MTTEAAHVTITRLEYEVDRLKNQIRTRDKAITRLRRDLKEWESGARLVAEATLTIEAPGGLTAPPEGVARWRVKFVDKATGTRVHYVNGHTAWDAYERTCRTPGLFPPGFGECEIRRAT
jgi:hypothetical protein